MYIAVVHFGLELQHTITIINNTYLQGKWVLQELCYPVILTVLLIVYAHTFRNLQCITVCYRYIEVVHDVLIRDQKIILINLHH